MGFRAMRFCRGALRHRSIAEVGAWPALLRGTAARRRARADTRTETRLVAMRCARGPGGESRHRRTGGGCASSLGRAGAAARTFASTMTQHEDMVADKHALSATYWSGVCKRCAAAFRGTSAPSDSEGEHGGQEDIAVANELGLVTTSYVSGEASDVRRRRACLKAYCSLNLLPALERMSQETDLLVATWTADPEGDEPCHACFPLALERADPTAPWRSTDRFWFDHPTLMEDWNELASAQDGEGGPPDELEGDVARVVIVDMKWGRERHLLDAVLHALRENQLPRSRTTSFRV